MIWTQSRICKLQTQAREAKKRIEELFINGAIPIGKRRVWGQFLDDPKDSNQYGIYGTSAGIQILVLGGYDPDTDPISSAFEALQEPYENQDSSHLFNQKGQFSILYKLASLAEVEFPNQDDIESPQAVMDELINRILPQGGWGEYFNSSTDRDLHSRVTATAIALLSLRRYRKFRSTSNCDNCLKWFCKRIKQDGKLRIFEIALALLVLIEYESTCAKLPDYRSTADYCIERLVSWTKTRSECQFGFTANYHYSRMYSSSNRNEYLFFLPDCLVTFALLKQGPPKQAQRYILAVIDFFTKKIIEDEGFTAESTERMSSVDHLWLYRLLSEFISKPIRLLRPYSCFHWVSANRFTSIFFPVIFTILAMVGFYLGYLNVTSASKSPFSWIIASALAGIGSSLSAGTILELLRGKES